MKKFFSLMLVALVMLGVTACEQDVTIDTPKSEGLSFYAEIAMTRADLEQGDDGKWATVWEGNETLTVYNEEYTELYKFTNSIEEPNKFSCNEEGVESIKGQNITIELTHGEDCYISEMGKKGLLISESIKEFNPTETISLQARNSFLRYTYNGEGIVTLSLEYEGMPFITSGNTSGTSTYTSSNTGEQWVSFVAPDVTDGSVVSAVLSYSINDIKVKETTINLAQGKIYNLGVLTDAESQNIVTDTLNRVLTGVTGTSYTAWSGKTALSTAVYAGNSAGGNESIQLRSNNSNSGIVTTTSGGKVKKVVVTWNSNTAVGRTLNIYGKNTAYAAATDLYDDSTQGTLLGTIVYGTSTELVIEGDYEYIGMHSNSGAMYLAEIQITWDTSNVVIDTRETLETPVFEDAEVTTGSIKVSWSVVANATSYDVAIDGGDPVPTTETEYTFDNLLPGTQYEISVVAKADGYKDSVAGTTTISTKAKQIIANGNYVIVANANKVMLTNEAVGSNSNALGYKSIENITDPVSTTADAIWYIEWDETTSTYLIKSVGNNCYLSGENGNRAFATKAEVDESCKISIAKVDNNGYNIKLNQYPDRKLGYNKTDTRFAFYTSSQDNTLLIIPAEVDTKPSFTVSPNTDQIISAEGGTIQFTVDTINGAVVTAESSADWLKIDNEFKATAEANNSEQEREATITFSAEGCLPVEVTVTQAALSTGDDTTTYLLNEEFDNDTTADSSSAIDNSKFPNFSGATEKAYTSKYGGIKLGTSSVVGYITSKSLDLSKAFTVTLDACKYGSDTGNIVVTVGDAVQTIPNSELAAAGTFKTFILTFDAATATSTVKIATSSKRAYIDNVKIAYTE